MSKVNIALLTVAILIIGFSLFNASWLAGAQPGRLELVAKDGIGQYAGESEPGNSCPSARIASEQPHNFIANSLVAIAFARSRSANYVEVDVRPTADGRLVLFGDDSVDCLTDGEGAVAELSLEALQRLDIGYWLTPDGEHFPLRGRGVGLMPGFDNLLRHSFDAGLILRFADPDPGQADMLAAEYRRLDREMDESVIVMGDPALLARIGERFPQAGLLDVAAAEACFDGYMRSGWLGIVPETCRDGFVSVPLDRQWMVWGWPNRFLARMRAANVRTMVVQSNSGDEIVPIADYDALADVPRDFHGLLWLADIYNLGPALRP